VEVDVDVLSSSDAEKGKGKEKPGVVIPCSFSTFFFWVSSKLIGAL
jgi:hypothetical protein